MRVLLLSAYDEPEPDYVPAWLVSHGSCGAHELTKDPTAADLIIFAETFSSLDPYFLDVLRHPVFQKHPQKCVLHHHSDGVVTFCRTVSPSVERWQPNQAYRRSYHYIARRRAAAFPGDIPIDVPRRSLFSFRGDVGTHNLRRRIMALRHAEADLINLSGSLGDSMPELERESFHQEYLRSILEAHFVLCPRGLGPTSMRLFEAMQLGRVPVIIGDTWKPVQGVPWEQCAVFVRERDIEQVPERLMALRGQAEEMGRKARAVWEEFFSPQQALQRLISESAVTLQTRHTLHTTLRDLGQLARMRDWRGLAGSCYRMLRFGKASRANPRR
jgi:hypothetical protein